MLFRFRELLIIRLLVRPRKSCAVLCVIGSVSAFQEPICGTEIIPWLFSLWTPFPLRFLSVSILEVSSGLPSAFVFKSIGFLLKVDYFFHGLDWKGLVERGALGRAHEKSKCKSNHLYVMSVSKKFKQGQGVVGTWNTGFLRQWWFCKEWPEKYWEPFVVVVFWTWIFLVAVQDTIWGVRGIGGAEEFWVCLWCLWCWWCL